MPARLDKDTEAFIDAIRGLAAIAVLVSHCFDFGIRAAFGHDINSAPESWQILLATVGNGSFFVWLFFVISGLCIHRSIARSMRHGSFRLRDYLAARVTRIYPLFLLGLLLAAGVWYVIGPPEGESATWPWVPLFSSLFSLQIFTGTFPNYVPSWSLSNEMIYYVAWPCALLVLRRRAGLAIVVSLSACIATCGIIAMLWLILHRLGTSTFVNGLWSASVLFPLWLCGALLAHKWEEFSQRVSKRLWLTSFALCLFAELVLARVKYIDGSPALVKFTGLVSIPGIMILVAGARHARLGSFSRARGLFRWLGQFSYPCYTLHMPLLILLNHQVISRLGAGVTTSPLLRSLAQLIPIFLFLAMVGPWLERTFMNWRAGYLARRAT
jgi:peptidoglycan/LPS O-acetylase OafA/YrhL